MVGRDPLEVVILVRIQVPQPTRASTNVNSISCARGAYNMRKKQIVKLLQQDFDRMWGEDGPYSQVNIKEQIRILDDHVSRTFLVVEAEINPFTFEFAQKNRKQFAGDEQVLQLLDFAENRDKFGYVVSAGEVELRDEKSRVWAREQALSMTETIIRLHIFVIETFNLKRGDRMGVILDKTPSDARYVWNEHAGGIEMLGEELWDAETLIGSPSGIINNKMRFFIVLAIEQNADFKKKSATEFAHSLKKISGRLNVDVEDIESFQDHVLILTLIPFDIAPATFVEELLKECGDAIKKPLFQKDYFVSNVKRPTHEQIASFLKQLPLDRDVRMT